MLRFWERPAGAAFAGAVVVVQGREGVIGIEAETMDEFEGYQEAGAAAVMALDRPGGVGGNPGESAAVTVASRRGERGRRIVSGMVTGLILRVTLGMIMVVMTGTGNGTGQS